MFLNISEPETADLNYSGIKAPHRPREFLGFYSPRLPLHI